MSFHQDNSRPFVDHVFRNLGQFVDTLPIYVVSATLPCKSGEPASMLKFGGLRSS